MKEFKTCSGCQIEQPRSGFYGNIRNKDGLHNQCKSCQSIYSKSPERRERSKLKSRLERANHPEKQRQRNAKYRAAHPEKDKRRKAKYQSENKEIILEKARQYRIKNAEKVKKAKATYLKKPSSRERMQERKRKMVAVLANAAGSEYTKKTHLTQRSNYFGGLCYICGVVATAFDHVKPISKGGSNFPANLRPICKSCNTRKKDKWLGTPQLPHLVQSIRTQIQKDTDFQKSLLIHHNTSL